RHAALLGGLPPLRRPALAGAVRLEPAPRTRSGRVGEGPRAPRRLRRAGSRPRSPEEKRMRILLVGHHLPPRHAAGTEVYTWRLAEALAKTHAVTVFATDDDPRRKPGSLARRAGPGFEVVEL